MNAFPQATASRRAAARSCNLHRAGEWNIFTGSIKPHPAPIMKFILPPLPPTGVLTVGLVERIDADLEARQRDYEAYRLHVLLTTGEELP